MNPRLTCIRTFCVFSCLFAQIAMLSVSTGATEAAKAVRLDGKTVYVPEIKLTQKVNPVDTFLHIGSWDIAAKARKINMPLCRIDPKNNSIIIDYPGNLLENSTTRVVTQDGMEAFINSITWPRQQITHIAFKIVSPVRRAALIEIYTNSDAFLFQNGRFAASVSADDVRASGGRGYLPITLEQGDNIINIKQYSVRGKPRFQLSVNLDYTQSLEAVWQAKNGLLKKLVYSPGNRVDPVTLDWDPNLSGFSVSLEVRDVSTDKIVLQKDRARRGRVTADDDADFAPGVYEALYRTKTGNETASELFLVGNPEDLFAGLQKALAVGRAASPKPPRASPVASGGFGEAALPSESKRDIDAQLRRAQILLAENNHNALDRQWQEKIAYTFSCLATFARQMKEGATNIAKDQPGLHIRGFASAEDDSDQFYRIYIPTTYKPGEPLPLLVIPAARMASKERPFIEGSIIANHREALLWAKYAEKYGFALLWPGYRGVPDGYSYESVHINEAIQAVEKDYAIDPRRISVYGTCSAGYNAGRLVEEYNNRFAAIVYDIAVFDLSLDGIQSSPSLMEWYTTVNPSPHVIDNRNIKIFALHDNSSNPGHGALELTTDFLDEAKAARNDVISHLSDYPMPNAARMDMLFSWLAACSNPNPDAKRSNFLTKAGYTGPIMEIFATPLLVVEGTRAQGADSENIHNIIESLQKDYANYFHGAQCAVKKDADVTEEDINTHSLILVGNPQSNSVWEKLQPKLSVKMTPTAVMYGDDRLTGFQPFQAIVWHPDAEGKYILMIGSANLKTLGQVTTNELFTAWYDSRLFSPDKIISKLDSLHDVQKIKMKD